MVLIFHVKLAEISAPSPNSYNESGIFFGMRLCIKKSLAADGIKLKLVAAKIYKTFDNHRNLLYSYITAKRAVVNLYGKRSAVDSIL